MQILRVFVTTGLNTDLAPILSQPPALLIGGSAFSGANEEERSPLRAAEEGGQLPTPGLPWGATTRSPALVIAVGQSSSGKLRCHPPTFGQADPVGCAEKGPSGP